MSIPILIVGDAPNLPTGLGRISRDLASLLWKWQKAGLLDIDIAQLGLGYNGMKAPWHIYKVQDETEWAAGDLAGVLADHFAGRPGILFSVWDPSRCFYLHSIPEVESWGYFPVDGHCIGGGFGGPAAATVKAYHRVLAYGTYGARVLKEVLGRGVEWLPHGLWLETWKPREGAERKLVGAVAANQVRKDYGVLFGAWAELKQRRPEWQLLFWLHTDLEVKAWSVPELVEQFGLQGQLLVTRAADGVDDETLRGLYSQCLATVAPGLGEGFGYPIAESMACGAPAVGFDYAGGAEYLAKRIEAAAMRVEGTYLIQRPVMGVRQVASALEEVIEWRLKEPAVVEAWCRGRVAHLGWPELERRWFSWWKQGIAGFRERKEKA